tara:strand:- start:5629 stop:6030 length:402 start_codon:yes stop_codon:yes gene_type:complete
MAVFTYIAKDRGSLVVGHSEDTEYSIEIGLSQWESTKDKNEAVTRPIDGPKFTVLHGIERGFSFKTVSTEDQAVIDGLIEMFDSVAAGEEFSIDPYGSIAVPDESFDVSTDGNYRQTREFQVEFSFSAKVDLV